MVRGGQEEVKEIGPTKLFILFLLLISFVLLFFLFAFLLFYSKNT